MVFIIIRFTFFAHQLSWIPLLTYEFIVLFDELYPLIVLRVRIDLIPSLIRWVCLQPAFKILVTFPSSPVTDVTLLQSLLYNITWICIFLPVSTAPTPKQEPHGSQKGNYSSFPKCASASSFLWVYNSKCIFISRILIFLNIVAYPTR